MYLKPKISLCLSVDGNNAIAYDEKPINSFAPSELKKIDYGILTNYLEWVLEERGYVVVGEKTYDDMKRVPAFKEIMSKSSISIIVVGSAGVHMLVSGQKISVHNPTKANVFNSVMAMGIKERTPWVHVLGGARVYEAFIHNFDEMVLGLYEEKLSDSENSRVISGFNFHSLLPKTRSKMLTTSEGVSYSLYHLKFSEWTEIVASKNKK